VTDILLDPNDTGEIQRPAHLGDDPTRNLAEYVTGETAILSYASFTRLRRPDATGEIPTILGFDPDTERVLVGDLVGAPTPHPAPTTPPPAPAPVPPGPPRPFRARLAYRGTHRFKRQTSAQRGLAQLAVIIVVASALLVWVVS
jgi:hypothetical protein